MSEANAVDFQIKGQWLVGFGLNEGIGYPYLVNKIRDNSGKHAARTNDTFAASQRVRLWLDANASESLFGTVHFEIGDQNWGNNAQGAALGADSSNVIELKHAYLDWQVPNANLRTRMGIQPITFPNKAGGSAIMDADSAAVVASYRFNDNAALTAMWLRPINDNFVGRGISGTNSNYLDNIDLFALTLPLEIDGFEIIPWAMYGILGKNALEGYNSITGPYSRYDNPDQPNWWSADGVLNHTLNGVYPGFNVQRTGNTGNGYGNMFFAGLPLGITTLDPWNIEFDINYGYVEGMGRFDVMKRNNPAEITRGGTERQGWLAKAQVEYKTN
jgi:hypothetical protein